MNKFAFTLIGLFLMVLSVPAQTSTENARLKSALQAFLNDADLKHASVGFCVIDVEGNQIIAEHQPEMSLIPASSLKTLTTGTALGILGSDYRFKTELKIIGPITENGVLKGNVVVKGYGDPTLGSPEMEGVAPWEAVIDEFVQKVKEAGIREIDGKVIGDGDYFETAVNAPSWAWNDIGNYYGAGISGLNIHENLYYLEFQLSSSLSTGPTLEAIQPEMPYMFFVNELESAGKNTGDNAYIYGAPYTYTRHIRGTLPIGSRTFKVKGSIPDPAYFVARELMNALEENGIRTGRIASSAREEARRGRKPGPPGKVIHTIRSPRLADVVQRANFESVNLYCESFLKTIGVKKKQEGSLNAGLEAVEEFWTDRGVNWDGIVLRDGSGLSPRNTLSAKHLATILRKLAVDDTVFPDFYKSLPAAGQSGTVKYMLKGTNAEGTMRLKSGSMSRVRTYSGYAKTRSGKLVSFSFMVNHFLGKSSAMRKKMESVLAAIADLP